MNLVFMVIMYPCYKKNALLLAPQKSLLIEIKLMWPQVSIYGTNFEEAERIEGSEGEESDYVAEKDLDNVFLGVE